MSIDFTIAFICHNEIPLLEKTIPRNIKSLCENTDEKFDIILVMDGVEVFSYQSFIEKAFEYGVNEVRLRSRVKNCATGDSSNNGHFHIFSEKTPYLITLEGDVVLFNLDTSFDILKNIRELFNRHQELCIATRMDDYDCWLWKLERVGQPFEEGVYSVNRVSSHFLVYDTQRFRKYLANKEKITLNSFYDNPESWYNYEDLISVYFAYPNGPGIAFLDSFPMRVYHCDRKIESGSPFYTKDLNNKLFIFHQREKEVELLLSKQNLNRSKIKNL